MIYREPFPLKKSGLWSLLIFCGLFTGYIVFVAMISIWVGFNHLQKDGFWMPVLAGTIVTVIILWLFLRLSKFILNQLKGKNTFNI
ncbi:MAG: hypothetical protein V3W19_13845 [Desulfatiglandales bacterium]